MDAERVVRTFLAFINCEPTVTRIALVDLPNAVRAALDAWVGANNIPVDDPDTSGDFYKIAFNVYMADTFVAMYSGINPDQFVANAIIQKDEVIGEYLDIGS